MWYTPMYNKKDVGKLENIAYTSSNLNNAKKQPVNHTIYPTIGLIAALTISPVLSLSCRNHTKKEQEATPVVAPKEYTIQDLEAALGARWYSLNNEQKDNFRKAWPITEEDIRKYIVEAYSNPEHVYGGFSEDEKKQFDAFKVSELDPKSRIEYKEAFPWMNFEQLTLSDKLVIDMMEFARYIFLLR